MTRQQLLLRLFMEENYNRLIQQHNLKDMMHEAYLTVFNMRRHIDPSLFERLIIDAYRRHILQEINYHMHFVMPDPLFWYHVEQQADNERIDEVIDAMLRQKARQQTKGKEGKCQDKCTQSKHYDYSKRCGEYLSRKQNIHFSDKSDMNCPDEQDIRLSEIQWKSISRYVRENVGHQDYHIFTLSFLDNKPIPVVAEIIGITPSECNERIEKLLDLVNKHLNRH